jgi:hypothetical protein
MKLTNQNIRRILRIVLIAMMVIAVGDLIFSQLNGYISELFKGYLFFIFPFMVVVSYAILGFPFFSFDAEASVLHIKSHLVLSSIIGKEVYIIKDNIVSMQVDRTGIRKKLHIRYIKNGQECKETFSVSMLTAEQLKKLMRYANRIEKELNRSNEATLFI